MSKSEQIVAEKFGRLIIEKMKDEPLQWFDVIVKGKAKSPKDRGFHKALAKLPKETLDLIRDCIIDATTTGIFDFLATLNEMNDFREGIQITVDGVDVFSVNDDGLHYELLGEDGWEAKFSKFPTSDEVDDKYAKYSESN